jgi:hypothetical protein
MALVGLHGSGQRSVSVGSTLCTVELPGTGFIALPGATAVEAVHSVNHQ